MWILLRSILRVELEFAINILELLESTQRNFIYTMMGMSLAFLFWVTADQPGDRILVTVSLMLLIGFVSAFSLRPLQRRCQPQKYRPGDGLYLPAGQRLKI